MELMLAELEGIELPRHAIILERPIKESGKKTIHLFEKSGSRYHQPDF